MRQFTILLLLVVPIIHALNYKCHNDQVLVVQSFGNDTIRMHCQRLDLCGYQNLKCDYDELQPQCGGRLNFVSHVNQKSATSPVEHTCCNLFNPRAPHAVPTHTGNDCFIYELPDGTTNGKKADAAPADDAPPYAVLKNPAEIPEQFDGITGYRLRLFLLKNKSPPTLLVKGIERRLDGYRVTICRPRCTSYDKVNEKTDNTAGETDADSEWRAISWSSWSSSSWSTWARHAFNKAASGGGDAERVRTREGDAKPPGTTINVNVNGVERDELGVGAGTGAGAGARTDGVININIHTGNATAGAAGGPGAVAVANASVNLNGNGSGSGNSGSSENGQKSGSKSSAASESGAGKSGSSGSSGARNSAEAGAGNSAEAGAGKSGKSGSSGESGAGNSGKSGAGDSGSSGNSGAGDSAEAEAGNSGESGESGSGKSGANNSGKSGKSGSSGAGNSAESGVKNSGNSGNSGESGAGNSKKSAAKNSWKDGSDEADDDDGDDDLTDNGGRITVNLIEEKNNNSTGAGAGETSGGSGTSSGGSGASGSSSEASETSGSTSGGSGGSGASVSSSEASETSGASSGGSEGSESGAAGASASTTTTASPNSLPDPDGDDDDVDVTDEEVGTRPISEKKIEELLNKLPDSTEIKEATSRADRIAVAENITQFRMGHREGDADSSSSSSSSSGDSSGSSGTSSSSSTSQTSQQSDSVQADAATGSGDASATSGMNCFAGDTLVATVAGPKRMDELAVGDFVLVPSSRNVLKYERVEMFYHREPATRAKFVVLFTQSGRTLALTARHLLPSADCRVMQNYINADDGIDAAMRESRYAEKARRGECVLSIDPTTGNLIADRIVRIGRKTSKGIYSPMTVEGSLVANGILSSCFSHLESHTTHKIVFDLLYKFYNLFGLMSQEIDVDFQPIPNFIQFAQDLSKHIIPFS